MIDNFSLLVSHGLVLLACWRLLWRADLDSEAVADPRQTLLRPPADKGDAPGA